MKKLAVLCVLFSLFSILVASSANGEMIGPYEYYDGNLMHALTTFPNGAIRVIFSGSCNDYTTIKAYFDDGTTVSTISEQRRYGAVLDLYAPAGKRIMKVDIYSIDDDSCTIIVSESFHIDIMDPDQDGDGLSNMDEYRRGTDYFDPDTDDDGINDLYDDDYISTVWFVDDNAEINGLGTRTAPFTSIQEAVNRVKDFPNRTETHTIKVLPGTYTEAVWIKEGELEIVGSEEAVIDTLNVDASELRHVQGTANPVYEMIGIFVEDTEDVTISHINIKNADSGVRISGCDGIVLDDVCVEDCDNGIRLDAYSINTWKPSLRCKVMNSKCSNNYRGIMINSQSHECEIYETVLEHNTESGIWMVNGCYDILINNNYIRRNYLGIRVDANSGGNNRVVYNQINDNTGAGIYVNPVSTLGVISFNEFFDNGVWDINMKGTLSNEGIPEEEAHRARYNWYGTDRAASNNCLAVDDYQPVLKGSICGQMDVPYNARIWHVDAAAIAGGDGSPNLPYQSIGEAIDKINQLTTDRPQVVFIEKGVYTESLHVKKSDVTLYGLALPEYGFAYDKTLLTVRVDVATAPLRQVESGNTWQSVGIFVENVDGFKAKYLTLTSANSVKPDSGIRINGGQGHHIQKVNVKGFKKGIRLDAYKVNTWKPLSGAEINRCEVFNNDYAIMINSESSGCDIHDNDTYYNHIGLWIVNNCYNNRFESNWIKLGAHGVLICNNTGSGNVFKSNTFQANTCFSVYVDSGSELPEFIDNEFINNGYNYVVH